MFLIIKETKIGLAVGKLRKHKNGIVASKSNALVDKWKQLVGKGGKASDNTPQENKQEPSPTVVKKESNGKEVKEEPKSEEKKRKVEKGKFTKRKMSMMHLVFANLLMVY